MVNGLALTSSKASKSSSVSAKSPTAMTVSPRMKYVPILWIATPFYSLYTRSSASLTMQFKAWSNPFRIPTKTRPSFVMNLTRLPIMAYMGCFSVIYYRLSIKTIIKKWARENRMGWVYGMNFFHFCGWLLL